MQLPPATNYWEPPLTEAQKGPAEYKWDPNYPGTLKPGLSEDNYPLEDVLNSGVYENMVFEETDMDDRTPLVFPLQEDLLEWLAKEGRLIPKDAADEDLDVEAEKQIKGITEEDLEYNDDDDKMIAYYSKQGEGSALGASNDFGGFSESFIESPEGFGA